MSNEMSCLLSSCDLVKSNSSPVLPVRGDATRIGSIVVRSTEGGVEVVAAVAVDIATAGRFRFGGVFSNKERS
jgi:hypothetical protein